MINQHDLHVFVDEKVETVKVEISETRLESVFDGVEAVQHNVLHTILRQHIYIARCVTTNSMLWFYQAV